MMLERFAVLLLACAGLFSDSCVQAATSSTTLLAHIDDPPETHLPANIDIKSVDFFHNTTGLRIDVVEKP